MNYKPDIDDEILQNLLWRSDATAASDDDSDAADELFALFLEGKLDEQDRDEFLQCLDASPQLRKVAAACLRNPTAVLPETVAETPCETASAPSRAQNRFAAALEPLRSAVEWLRGGGRQNTRQRWQHGADHSQAWTLPWARPLAYQMVAAMLLLIGTLGVWWLSSSHSSHLPMLAMRGGPNLMDYGYIPGFGAARDASPQPDLELQPWLNTVPNADERNQLGRAFNLLNENSFKEAHKEFIALQQAYPHSYFAFLGGGLASYMMPRDPKLSELKDSADMFEQALRINPDSTAAKIGRAMALARLDRNADSLAYLRQVAGDEHLPTDQRAAIEAEIARLSRKLSN